MISQIFQTTDKKIDYFAFFQRQMKNNDFANFSNNGQKN